MELTPTEKQIEFATAIADALDIKIPKAVYKDRQNCSDFISKYQVAFYQSRKSGTAKPKTATISLSNNPDKDKPLINKKHNDAKTKSSTQDQANPKLSANVKLLRYWHDVLVRTAFDSLGSLPSQIEGHQSFPFNKIEYVLNNFHCKDLTSYQNDEIIRHLVIRIVPKSQNSSSANSTRFKPIVIAVFPLSINLSLPNTSNSSGQNSLPYSWERATGELPIFNHRQIGEQAEIDGLMLDNSQALNELLNKCLHSDTCCPANADLQQCIDFLDDCFNALTDAENGVSGWIARFNQQGSQFPALRNKTIDFVLVDGNAASGSTKQVRNCYADLIMDNTLLGDSKLNLFRKFSLGHTNEVDDSPQLYQPSTEEFKLSDLMRYFGHMDSIKLNSERECYALDDSQRLAISLFSKVKTGNLLAVNGPPGTGKTSLLRAVIANEWIKPLITDQKMPRCPVILACAATNQAVTNIISSFDKVPGPILFDENGNINTDITVAIESRWIPHLHSYGWYAPASVDPRKESEQQNFQVITRKSPNKPWQFHYAAENFGRSSSNINAMEKSFLAVSNKYFNQKATLKKTASLLRNQLKTLLSRVEDISKHLNAWLAALFVFNKSPWGALQEELRNELHKKCMAWNGSCGLQGILANELTQTEGQIQTLTKCAKELLALASNTLLSRIIRTVKRLLEPENDPWVSVQDILNQFDVELPAGEPSLNTWLDAINLQIRILNARLKDQIININANNENYETSKAQLNILEEARKNHNFSLDRLETHGDSFVKLLLTFNKDTSSNTDTTDEIIKIKLHVESIASTADPALIYDSCQQIVTRLQRWLDINVRPKLFHIAARYWEARYLIYKKSKLAPQKSAQLLTPSAEEQLRELAMLAPVFVVTTYSAPKLMKQVNSNHDSASENYLYGFAELLIVDEAGQATPEIGACSFAFAQRAIVVGDTKQLEPIWNIDSAAIDSLIINKHGLYDLAHNNNESKPGQQLYERGLLSSCGSIMRMAQFASAFFDEDCDEHGVMLTNHYRCRAPIIEICNQMVYGGVLKVVTAATEPKNEWQKPLGFLVVDGESTKIQGDSRGNISEAELIAQWIKEKSQSILDHYNLTSSSGENMKGLADLVAIVTPFKAQVPILKKAIAKIFCEDYRDPNSIANQMVIGTVHTLQGAEKNIVIFSMVDTKAPESDHFYDRGTNQMNVAISRAKEVFILTLDQSAVNYIRTLGPHQLNKPSDFAWYYVINGGLRLNSRRLLVIESPNKSHHIEAALAQGLELEIVATNGHLTQLYSGIDWDPLTAKEPRWENISEKEVALYERIALLWHDLEAIYVATDPDAEGECIAWHFISRIRSYLPKSKSNGLIPSVKIKRMRYYSLAQDEICNAYNHATEGLNSGMIKSALSRTILDQIISRHYPHKLGLQQPNCFSPGIGRVQLAILDIVNTASNPNEQYMIIVKIPFNDGHGTGTFILSREDSSMPIIFESKQDAKKSAHELTKLIVKKENHTLSWQATIEQVAEYPTINTAKFLALASRTHDLPPVKTMAALQALYEGRTEATNDTNVEN